MLQYSGAELHAYNLALSSIEVCLKSNKDHHNHVPTAYFSTADVKSVAYGSDEVFSLALVATQCASII